MPDSLTQHIQDYLKQIYDLSLEGKAASTTDLAARLKVKPASVTGMVQRLSTAEPALVNYQKHQGVTLTEAGRRAALEVIRHHRLLETWLVQTLGYAWDEVHQEAERLEHVISEEMEARIAAALGYPARDPHGDLIPSAELAMPVDDLLPLAALRPPQQARIVRVQSSEAAFLRHIEQLMLMPGTQIKVVGYSAFDNNLTVEIDHTPVVIGLSITTKIFVALV